MYYLVRDYYDETEKKIFSDKDDIEEHVDKLDPDKRVQLLVYNWEDGMYSDCRNGKRIYFDQYYILKKSENVCDFIEAGDLIRYDNDFMGTYIIGEVYLNCGELETRDEQRIKHLDIHEIYKPDKHGNYIKVWERGNQNDR